MKKSSDRTKKEIGGRQKQAKSKQKCEMERKGNDMLALAVFRRCS